MVISHYKPAGFLLAILTHWDPARHPMTATATAEAVAPFLKPSRKVLYSYGTWPIYR